MTVEIEMSDEDFKAFSEYAAENKISLSEFFLESAQEKIPKEYFSEENFNAETIAAMNDTLLIAEGKIPAKSFNNVQELMGDLMSDVDN